jgi:hypothetical protein
MKGLAGRNLGAPNVITETTNLCYNMVHDVETHKQRPKEPSILRLCPKSALGIHFASSICDAV